MRKCSVLGCSHPASTRGMCDKHYRRWRRANGYVHPVRSWTDPGVAERFWRKAEVQDNGCWEWKGSRNSRGYGLFMLEGSAKLVHRVAWEACEGPIPEGLTIDHHCMNKTCVNPLHMEVVTRAENSSRGGSNFNRVWSPEMAYQPK